MREGLLPNTVTTVMRLSTTEGEARAMTELLGEVFEPEDTAVSAFEDESLGEYSGIWLLEAYFAVPPDEDAIRELVGSICGVERAAAARFDSVSARDWVAASLDGLKPVEAGRFIVHGSHDRKTIAKTPQAIAIEIEAALAFGTGHHGTTRGCLLAIDDAFRRGRPRRILDVGTGTGVLAIAAARVGRRMVMASDIDPVAIDVARENAAANSAGALVRFVVCAGVRDPALTAAGPYDLVIANILARPLMRMARAICTAAAPQGQIILSGLLERDVNGVASIYAAQGFALQRKSSLEGWATLVLRRGGVTQRVRRSRHA